MQKSKIEYQKCAIAAQIAWSVERGANRKKPDAKRYPLNAQTALLRPFYRKAPDKSSCRHIIGVVFAGLDAITGYNLP